MATEFKLNPTKTYKTRKTASRAMEGYPQEVRYITVKGDDDRYTNIVIECGGMNPFSFALNGHTVVSAN